MSTATSLNLRALLKTAVARSGMDVPARVVSGLTASAKALHVAAAAQARASAAGLLPRVTAPERLAAASLELKTGQDVAPTDLAELLVDAGFTREDPADQQGEFAVRGGIVDVFPAGETLPVRLEFIGDTIE